MSKLGVIGRGFMFIVVGLVTIIVGSFLLRGNMHMWDKTDFKKLFEMKEFKPDMLKIYPALVLKDTPLYDDYKLGNYKPYSTEEMINGWMGMAITYKKAGVDISEIKKSQRAIGKLIESTHNLQKLAKMKHGFGHYAGIVEIPGGKLLATHTDGVGTKVIISNMLKRYDTI